MNYIDESAKVLRNYRRLKLSVIISERRLIRLYREGSPTYAITSTLDLSGIRTSKRRDAEQISYEIIELECSLAETKEIMSEIDQLLIELSNEPGCRWYEDFLRAWYIEKMPKKEIEYKFNYGQRNIYKMRDKVIRAFAVAYHGIRPLKGM